MKKVIIVLLLILIKNIALAGHVGFSNDENLLIYIPASILIIWWIVKVIRKNYIIFRAQFSDTVHDPESKAPIIKGQANTDSEIPEFFIEKDVFGLDKPSTKVDVNIPLPDTNPTT